MRFLVNMLTRDDDQWLIDQLTAKDRLFSENVGETMIHYVLAGNTLPIMFDFISRPKKPTY